MFLGSAVEDEGNLVASMIESAESGDNNPQNLSQELNRRVQNQPQVSQSQSVYRQYYFYCFVLGLQSEVEAFLYEV